MRVWIETNPCIDSANRALVTLRVRVWIETGRAWYCFMKTSVTLRVRVWIETERIKQQYKTIRSPSA